MKKGQFNRTVPLAIILLQLLGWTACVNDDYTPKTITITSPSEGQQLEVQQGAATKAGSFKVSGTSTGIYPDRKLKIYVLVHPTDPASDWFVQPATTLDQNGQWTGPSWIGNLEFAPEPGHQLEIVAIASDKKPANQVADQRDLDAVARSSVVKLTIGSIKPPPK